MIFNCHNYSEEKKVQIAALEFSGYALVWWNELGRNRRRNHEPPIITWEEMKRVMRKKYVPTYYYREVHHQLQRLTQGSKSVDEYSKEMETLMIKASFTEDEDQTMARFLGGLNQNIADVVELYPYVDLEDLINIAIKVEKQHKQKWTANKPTSSSNSKWGSKWNSKAAPQSLISLHLKKVHSLLKTFLIIKVKMKQPLNLLELEIFNVLNVRGLGIMLMSVLIKRP